MRFITHAKQHYNNKITVKDQSISEELCFYLHCFKMLCFIVCHSSGYSIIISISDISLIIAWTSHLLASRSNVHGHWFDPKNWLDEQEYGVDEIETFSHHFSMPLVESGFEVQKCFSEWKRFKFYVKANYKTAISQKWVPKPLSVSRNHYFLVRI